MINTTLAFAGNIPFAGKGKTIPPPVMDAFTLVIKAGFTHSPFHESAAVGQLTFRVAVLIGFCPTWKNAISWSYSVGEQASTIVLKI